MSEQSFNSAGAPEDRQMVVIDLGKKKRKKVKALRRGEGDLIDDVREAVAELRAQGVLAENAQPVVVVVREKSRNGTMPWPGLIR